MYETAYPLEARSYLPYKESFKKLKDAPEDFWMKINKNAPVFYRGRIKHYSQVSAQLFGAMTEAARISLRPVFADWIWKRDATIGESLKIQLGVLIKQMAQRYGEFVTRP